MKGLVYAVIKGGFFTAVDKGSSLHSDEEGGLPRSLLDKRLLLLLSRSRVGRAYTTAKQSKKKK
jgi:hypothetical protein